MFDDTEHSICELLKAQAMIRRSFGTVAESAERAIAGVHKGAAPVDRINYSEDGRSRTKAVIPEDAGWAKEISENYKRFRKNRKALRSLEKKINPALDDLKTKVVYKIAGQSDFIT